MAGAQRLRADPRVRLLGRPHPGDLGRAGLRLRVARHPEVDGSLYSADPSTVIDVLRGAPEDAAVVVYVGHNPTAASLAHVLDDGEPDPTAFRAVSEGFPAAAMAVLEVPVPWADLDAGTAHLVDFHVGQA